MTRPSFQSWIFCVTGLAKEVEAASRPQLIGSECSVDSILHGYCCNFLVWLGNKPVSRNVLLGIAVACADEQFFALQGGCPNDIFTVRGQGKARFTKRTSLEEVCGSGEQFVLMGRER